MDSLHVHRFRARHEVADDEGRRLAQAAQQALLDGELEGALSQVLGAGEEIVLLRRLSARVRLQAGRSERDHARAWGDALALGLEQALQQGDAAEVLRFAHRGRALAAFAADALHGVDRRDWAWQRLGLLPATRDRRNSPAQRHAALLRCLADDATHSVPLLRSLQAGAHWAPLLQRLHDGELRGLVQATLAQLAGPGALPFMAMPVGDEPVVPVGDPVAASAARLPAGVAATAASAGSPVRALWALRLAAMLAQSALARRGARAVDALVAQWLQALPAEEGASPRRQQAAARDEPAAPMAAETVDLDGRARTPARRAGDAAGGTAAPAAPAAHTDRGDGPRPGADTRPQPARDAGHTAHGGLLLLTPLLPACGALALLEDPDLWPAGALPQALHRLALQLAPLRDDDPAALAFCGLAPLSPPPAHWPAGPRPAAAQEAALQAAQSLLEVELARRLPDWCGPGLLQRVLARPARISADPGWIEVHFRLRDVAVEIRRAALDLDPGFLPWLGAVLRYRYE